MRFDFVTQAFDEDAKGMHSLAGVEPPECAHQFGAWHSPVQVPCQVLQQAALRGGQVDFLVASLDTVRVQVNGGVTYGEASSGGLRRCHQDKCGR